MPLIIQQFILKHLLFALILASQVLHAQRHTEHDFQKYFNKHGVEGCFVVYDKSKNHYIRHNASLCDTGYLPASTFKIPNALIALEEEIVKDSSEVLVWNGHEWPIDAWNQNQTLSTAIQKSCIWYFFHIAQQVGMPKYYNYVRLFDYGNLDLTGPPTRFWLEGSFEISANEQIDFLHRFYYGLVPVAPQHIQTVKNIIRLKTNETYTLSGKTGAASISETEHILWFVGYVEKNGAPYFFALNFVTDRYTEVKNARKGITLGILKELQIIN